MSSCRDLGAEYEPTKEEKMMDITDRLQWAVDRLGNEGLTAESGMQIAQTCAAAKRKVEELRRGRLVDAARSLNERGEVESKVDALKAVLNVADDQLDTARKARDEALDAKHRLVKENAQLAQEKASLIRERDEAIKEKDKAIEDLHMDGYGGAESEDEIEELKQELDAYKERAEALQSEIHELRVKSLSGDTIPRLLSIIERLVEKC